MSQKAENEFVGVNCGIMDQYINIFGAAQKFLKSTAVLSNMNIIHL